MSFITLLQIATSWSGKPWVVLDLRFPAGASINKGIPKETYLDELFSFRLPGVDTLLEIICWKDPSCNLVKKDLSRAYRQLRINPHDHHLLRYQHYNKLYFNIWQLTTSAVTFIYKDSCLTAQTTVTSLAGLDHPSSSTFAFSSPNYLFESHGLQASPNKDCPSSTELTFLGVLLVTVTIAMSVKLEQLSELST